jgi:type II secretory pathway component GspD/PulD (secretin)
MTLAAPSTITLMAASLLLAAGVATAVVTAEPAQIPTRGPVQPVPAPSDVDKAMDQQLTLDFQDEDLTVVIANLHSASNQNFILDPRVAVVPHPITLKVTDMRLRDVLAHIERLTGTTHAIRNEAYFIHATGAIQPPKPVSGIDLTAADMNLRTKMEQRITLDFQNAPLTDIIANLHLAGTVNIVVMPAVASGTITATLRLKEMQLQNALTWLCEITGTSVRYVDQALVFDVAPANSAPAGGIAPQPVQPVQPPKPNTF